LEIFGCDCLSWNTILVLKTSTRRGLIRILKRNTVYNML
jgi:hypothetical protein